MSGGGAHNHTVYVDGCFRCDISRDESRPAVLGAMRMLRESNPSPAARAEIEKIEGEWKP